MDVVGELVARERRSEAALLARRTGQPYTYHTFCTECWKAASLFRYHGVGPDRPVRIADDRDPQSLLAFFGTTLLGAPAGFGAGAVAEPRLVVGPGGETVESDLPAGAKRVAYGDHPDDPTVIHFERDRWSENPTEPPDAVDPDRPALLTGDATYTHAALLSAAAALVDDGVLDGIDAVAIRASLTHPGTVVAGVIAPILAGRTIRLPVPDDDAIAPADDVVVVGGDSGSEAVVDPGSAVPEEPT